ncbi:MAG: TIR domain-containing protein [Anaerolineales bacterium]|nr:TIR domain-containing protein [Anaerolineales bacterium]MCB9113107.1 TIR domain-containing protein [Anaerolineales bacterium]
MAESGSIKVFISYSRRDKIFAQQLTERLKSKSVDVWADWEDLPPSSNWMEEVQNAIEECDAYIFIISPNSLKSQVVLQELEMAERLNKRLIPILHQDINFKEIPTSIASTNWLYIRNESEFESSFPQLIEAIQTDFGWIKTHTRVLQRALEWERHSRDKSYLLRGTDFETTQQAVTQNSSKAPQLTQLQREYLLASQEANKSIFDRLRFTNAAQTEQVQSAETTEAPPSAELTSMPVEVGKLFSVSTDQPNGVDQLNYTRFADAFATLIKNPEAKTPITIGIYGQWGSGKSFLMKKIKESLAKADAIKKPTRPGKLFDTIKNMFRKKDSGIETIVIEFNAWVYSGSEHLWASLVTHLYKEVEKYFGLRMQANRLMKAIRRLFPKALNVFLFYAIPGLIISLLIGFDKIQASWEAASLALKAVGVSIVGGSLLATLPTLWTALREFGDTLFMSQALNLQKLASKPDFRDKIGIMADIKSEIGFISQMLENRNKKRQTRIVLFIDDLDRCEHRKAVEVLQAIMLLLADRDGSPFVIFLGIDARVIVRAVEEHYGSVLVKAGINGYEYLDKIVQMPFVIPFSNRKDIGNYIESLIWTKAEKDLVESKFHFEDDVDKEKVLPTQEKKAEAPPTPPQEKPASQTPEEPAPQIQTEAVPVTFTKPEREALKECVDDIVENPRKIKRIVNIYRFVRLLLPPNFQEHRKVIRWILMTEQWPLHTAWILEHVENDFSLKGKLSQNKSSNIQDIYQKVKDNIYADEMDELMLIDSDPIAFRQFIQKDPVFTTQEIYYLLYPLTFNLNPAVRSEITKYKARMAEKFLEA